MIRLLDIIDRVLTFLYIDVRDTPQPRGARRKSLAQKRGSPEARRLSVAGLASIVAGMVATGSWLFLLLPVGLVVVAIAWLKGDRLGLTVVAVAALVWRVATVVWVLLNAG